MNIKRDYFYKNYKKEIRGAFSEKGRERLLAKLIDATILYNDDKQEKAIKKLLKLRTKCETADDHCAVLMFIALCYDDLNYFTPAIEAYAEILEYDDKRSTVHSNLGLLYRRMGEYQKSVEIFKRAIECDGGNPYAHNNLGLAYYRMGDYEEAVECCERALAIKGNLYQAANCLCLSKLMLGDVEESKRYYKLAVHNGSNPETLKAEMKKLAAGAEIYKNDDLFWDL